MYQAHKRYHYGNLQSGPGFLVPAGGGVNMGFNFRATSGYVTDGANQVYVLPADTYPTTRGGFTFGWVVDGNTVFSADRDNAGDVRLAGINYISGIIGGTPTYFRVDIAPGTYNIYLAVGDTVAQTTMFVEVKDTTTSKFTIGNFNTAINHYVDANGTDHTRANWPANNTSRSVAFATNQFRLYPGNIATNTDVTTLAHLRITQ